MKVETVVISALFPHLNAEAPGTGRHQTRAPNVEEKCWNPEN